MLFRISAIQKLKANHNYFEAKVANTTAVPNISYSEIESKSQQRRANETRNKSCSEYQLFRN